MQSFASSISQLAGSGRAKVLERPGLLLLVQGIAAVAVLQLSLGLYATALNNLFYAHFGPFYDSLASLDSLARMQAIARSRGPLAAFWEQVRHSTVVYPWMLFAPFARYLAANRANGIWLQIVASA